MTYNIVVIGAGQGGLVAAAHLAQHGHNVKLYERNPRNEVSYPWKDVFTKTMFPTLGMVSPDESLFSPEPAWTFISPSLQGRITIPENPANGSISMNRRHLSAHLIAIAEECGVELHFESHVTELCFDGDAVCGVVVGGEKVSADLVIDASGLLTPFRGSIPARFGLQAMPAKDDVMSCWRGGFRRKAGSPDPENKNHLFLRPNNLNGIAWCVLEEDDTVDVLIGQIGGMTVEERDNMLAFIRENCPILPDEEPIYGRYASICVRYAMPVLVADGYCLVGDSSCLTMPIIGSGIDYAMLEGYYIADMIVRNEITSFDAASLWRYNVEIIRKFGSETIGLDIMKRALLTMPEQNIDEVFATGVISGELLFDVMRGSIASAFKPKTVIAALKNMKTLLPVGKMMMPSLSAAGKAKKVAKHIPKTYDYEKIAAWKDKYNGFFNN